MTRMAIAGAALLVCMGTTARAEEPAAQPTPKKMPPEYTITVKGADGMSDDEVAAAIKAEDDKRDPEAQAHAASTKRQAEAQTAHDERIRKVCDSIPEKAMRDDPSLRKMCNE